MSQDALPPSLAAMLKEGALFEGKYRMVKAIGQGSFASVVHARHEAMDRDVALKVLRPDVAREQPEVADRFLTESRLASRLTSAHTVMIYDFGRTEEGVPYMVLEYVDGRPLDYVIEKHDGLGPKRSIRVTLQILESLEEAHSHNIIHRDLKPANVMVGRGMKREKEGVHVKVLDFGVAKLVDEAESGVELEVDESGRRSTQFIGTPRYMSPEQILGREVRPASDLYSLGLIFFEMCTDKPSIPGDNVARVAQTHLSEKRLKLEGLEELPKVVQQIVLKATARQPEDRFQNAEEFRKALVDALKTGHERNRRARRVPSEPPADTDEEPIERTSDVFSGEGYVAPPDEEELVRSSSSTGSGGGLRPPSPSSSGAVPRPPGPGRRSPTPGKSSKQSGKTSAADADTARAAPQSDELELDIESVERQQREVKRRQRYGKNRTEYARRAAASDNNPKLKHWFGGIGGVAVAGYVGFAVVGGAMSGLGTVMRMMMGMMPVGLALAWALFSAQATYQDPARRVVVPWAKRSVTMALLSVLVLGLVMPTEASTSLQDDGLWFVELLPLGLQLGWFAGLTEMICSTAAHLLEVIGGIVPWGN